MVSSKFTYASRTLREIGMIRYINWIIWKILNYIPYFSPRGIIYLEVIKWSYLYQKWINFFEIFYAGVEHNSLQFSFFISYKNIHRFKVFQNFCPNFLLKIANFQLLRLFTLEKYVLNDNLIISTLNLVFTD